MMAKGYVSEFTNFMDRYLKEHPEVVEEQRRCAGVLLQGETRPDGSSVNPPQLTIAAAPGLPRAPWRFFKKRAGSRG
jgi:hypothetical protein